MCIALLLGLHERVMGRHAQDLGKPLGMAQMALRISQGFALMKSYNVSAARCKMLLQKCHAFLWDVANPLSFGRSLLSRVKTHSSVRLWESPYLREAHRPRLPSFLSLTNPIVANCDGCRRGGKTILGLEWHPKWRLLVKDPNLSDSNHILKLESFEQQVTIEFLLNFLLNFHLTTVWVGKLILYLNKLSQLDYLLLESWERTVC